MDLHCSLYMSKALSEIEEAQQNGNNNLLLHNSYYNISKYSYYLSLGILKPKNIKKLTGEIFLSIYTSCMIVK